MIQRFLTALLLIASASALAAGQPEPKFQSGPNVLFYAAGRAYLGIDVKDVTSDRVSALKLKEERGVEITMVDQDAPAGKAGLKEHDVVLDFNGARVEGEEQLRRMIRETPVGRTVTLGISRDGNPMQIQVQVGDRGKIEAQNFPGLGHGHTLQVFPPDMPEMPEMPQFVISTYAPSLGMQVDNVGQQLGEFFGVKHGEGVLVKSVEKGSAAEKAGVKAGDVIVRAENEKISDRTDLRRILRSHREGGKLTLGIVRDKREQNVTVEVPAARKSRESGFEFTLPDFEGFDELRSTLKEMQPEINRRMQMELQQLRPQLRKTQLLMEKQIKPELEKTLQQTRSQMQQLRKQLEQQQKALQKVFDHSFI